MVLPSQEYAYRFLLISWENPLLAVEPAVMWASLTTGQIWTNPIFERCTSLMRARTAAFSLSFRQNQFFLPITASFIQMGPTPTIYFQRSVTIRGNTRHQSNDNSVVVTGMLSIRRLEAIIHRYGTGRTREGNPSPLFGKLYTSNCYGANVLAQSISLGCAMHFTSRTLRWLISPRHRPLKVIRWALYSAISRLNSSTRKGWEKRVALGNVAPPADWTVWCILIGGGT